MPGVVPSQVQDSALLTKLHEIFVSPSLQPVEVWMAAQPFGESHPPVYVICEFTDGALYPTIQIINEDVKQDWTWY